MADEEAGCSKRIRLAPSPVKKPVNICIIYLSTCPKSAKLRGFTDIALNGLANAR